MQPPPNPADEVERLRTLRELRILDTPAEERFDRLTRLCQHLFDVPISLVSLVDENRQWFKSRVGLDATETTRDISFCGHSILDDEVFVIPNALRDARFADNPLVTGGPKIRFYAGAPLTAPGGARLGTLCVISPEPREVTQKERRLLRDLAGLVEQELFFAELNQAREAASAANDAKTQFLASMAHEIRTPLHAILASTELLKDRPLDQDSHQLSKTIHSAGEGLLWMVNDLLDLTKIEAGHMELERIPFRLRSILEDSLSLMAIPAANKGINLETEIDPATDRFVSGDPHRLRQVLLNLLQNALKFTDAGRIRLRAQVECPDAETLVATLAVQDSGIGIAADRVHSVFQAYRQAERSTARRFGGTGLGLPICRELVERMGGTLRVESTLGEGSTFFFSIPFRVEEAPVQQTQAAAVAPSSRALKLLVVDDNPLNRRVAEAQAKKLGHRVQTVDSAEEALTELEQESRYDLVLMDLNMPGMSGLEATRALRKRGVALPILAMTASDLQEERQEAADAGMDGFITKPVRLEELQTHVDKAIHG